MHLTSSERAAGQDDKNKPSYRQTHRRCSVYPTTPFKCQQQQQQQRNQIWKKLIKSESPPHLAHQQLPKRRREQATGAGCRVSMTTSWLRRFPPQISIYNRILSKDEKGGENTSWSPHKSKHALNELVSKAEPAMGVPAKAGGGGARCDTTHKHCSLFSPPTEDQFSLQ